MVRLAEIMGCKVGRLPSSYLGLPLCHGSVSKSLWDPVLESTGKSCLFGRQITYLWAEGSPL